MQARYINPYTDFGFKKIFGDDSVKDLVQPQEREQYEESLKVYRDIVNVVNASFEKGEKSGMEKG